MSHHDHFSALPRIVVAVLVAVALIGAPALTSTAGARPGIAAAGPKPIETVTVHSNGHKYVLKVWARTKSRKCVKNAYGKPVRTFLRKHRCGGLTRWLVTTKVNGRGVGFAQSATSFNTYAAAGHFRGLVTKNGTGNFYSLFADGYHLPRGPQSVPDPDAFKALAQDTGVTIVDAWYLHGKTPRNARPLVRMAENIYLQWY